MAFFDNTGAHGVFFSVQTSLLPSLVQIGLLLKELFTTAALLALVDIYGAAFVRGHGIYLHAKFHPKRSSFDGDIAI